MSGPARSRFETTRWSLVAAAGGDDSRAHRALATLCEAYWYPLYAYVRRQGFDADDARDLTQSFFVRLLERQDIRDVRPERGRFRAFLLASLRHFLLNDLVHRRALKRGGGRTPLLSEFEHAEGRYVREPADRHTPETLFERGWALTVLDRVLRRLQRDWEAEGRGLDFHRLRGWLLGEPPTGGYKALGEDLGVTEGTARVAVHRLRRRFQRQLRETIGETVHSDEAIDEEIQHLFNAVNG